MTVEDFNPAGPISVSHWNAAVADLTRRTEAGGLAWTKIQVYEAIEPVFQAQTGQRLVQLAARPAAAPTDFLMGSVWGGMAEGCCVLKVYDAQRQLILTSSPLESLDGLRSAVEAHLSGEG